MSDEDSDRPIRRTGLSAAYPDMARVQERNLITFKTHWDRIRNVETAAKQRSERIELASEERDDRLERESKERDDRLERNLTTLSTAVHEATMRLVELRTKMAMFATLGGIVGATIGSIITALILHFLIKK